MLLGSVMDAAWTASTDFFDLPIEMKIESQTEDEKIYPYGYVQSERLTLGKELLVSTSNSSSSGDSSGDKVAVPVAASPVAIGTTSTTLAPADLKESFSIGPCNPDAGEPPRRFPAQPVTFQPALIKYYTAMEDLAALLLRIFAMALDLPPDWFQDKTDHHMSALRVLNYFAVDRVSENDDDGKQSSLGDVPQPVRPLRAGAHTDYGALTILKSGGPGLQVKKDVGGSCVSKHEDSYEWVDVPDLPDSYIINLGDLMQRWTNGTLRFTFILLVVYCANKVCLYRICILQNYLSTCRLTHAGYCICFCSRHLSVPAINYITILYDVFYA
jgi:isopenicillin N synthase-like dioxygenase